MYDVLIIGSGPAGLSAAIYAARANKKVLIIENDSIGGKLTKINKIDNYPGFKSINGSDLAQELVNHAKEYNIEIINDKIEKISEKTVYGTNNQYNTKTIIVCTGLKEKALDNENAKEYIGKGISYCATCDGFFYKNKDVAVIGDDYKALEDAIYLSKLANKVYLISSRKELISDEKLLQEVKEISKIELIMNNSLKNIIISENKISGIELNDRTINCVGIFPHVGVSPNTSFLDTELLDKDGFVIVGKEMKTAIPYLFAAGDVTNNKLKQVVTATSQGAIAATSAISYLNQ